MSKGLAFKSRVICVALSPDQQFVAVATDDHRIRMYQADSDDPITSVAWRGFFCLGMRLSKGGEVLFCECSDGMLDMKRRFQAWDISPARLKDGGHAAPRELTLPDAGGSCGDLSPDGATIVLGDAAAGMTVVEVTTGREHHSPSLAQENVLVVQFGSEAELACIAWKRPDPDSAHVDLLHGPGFEGGLSCKAGTGVFLGVGRGGSIVVAEGADGDDRRCGIVDLCTGKKLFEIEGAMPGREDAGRIFEDGRHLGVLSRRSLQVWSLSTGALVYEQQNATERVECFAGGCDLLVIGSEHKVSLRKFGKHG